MKVMRVGFDNHEKLVNFTFVDFSLMESKRNLTTFCRAVSYSMGDKYDLTTFCHAGSNSMGGNRGLSTFNPTIHCP